MVSDVYAKNKAFRLSSVADIGFGYEGYAFAGWKTDLCGDVLLPDGAEVLFGADDVVLSAQW